MIVYNVQRAWFAMKNDAEDYRKTRGLPPASTIKVAISDRDKLAGLLNGICGITGTNQASIAASVPPEVIERSVLDDNLPPDCVPRFLVKEWEQRNRKKGSDE